MENNCYIESRRDLALMSEALNLAAKPHDWLCKEILEMIPRIKSIRRFDWESTNSWDCGRQDALGDKFEYLYSRWEALKCARRIQRDDARQLKSIFERVIGNAN